MSGFAAPGAITRTIAPGCATLLEAADDSNNSAADFSPGSRHSAQQRHPADRDRLRRRRRGRWRRRREGGDTSPPETKVTKGPEKSTNKRKVKIKFESSESGSTFMCKLDKRAFKACASPFKKRVGEGRHKFLVYAIDAAGNSDQTPAKLKFRVVGD